MWQAHGRCIRDSSTKEDSLCQKDDACEPKGKTSAVLYNLRSRRGGASSTMQGEAHTPMPAGPQRSLFVYYWQHRTGTLAWSSCSQLVCLLQLWLQLQR